MVFSIVALCLMAQLPAVTGEIVDCTIQNFALVPGMGPGPYTALACPSVQTASPHTCSPGQYLSAVGGFGVGGTCSTPAAATSIAYVPSKPTRAFNSTFTPSASLGTFVSYQVNYACALTLAGGQSSAVQLLADPGAPTNQRGGSSNGLTGTLIVGLAINGAGSGQIVALLPPGYQVRLVPSAGCTATLVDVNETTIGLL